jgi:hypothetical protein
MAIVYVRSSARYIASLLKIGWPNLPGKTPAWLASIAKPSIGLLLGLYVLAWVLSHLVSDTNLDSYGDMLENYAWGQTFSWGSDKHPPLVGWVTGLWFKLLPSHQGYYHLLSYGSSAIGLSGIYVLAGHFGLSRRARLAATLMMSLALPYSTLAVKMNANAILLPLWPWVVVCWCAAQKESGWRAYGYCLLLGVLAGLSLLGKYYSGVLLLSLGIVTLMNPLGRAWLVTPKPWLSLVVLLVMLAPHINWLVQSKFASFSYVQDQGTGEVDTKQLLKFALAPLSYWLLAWIATLATVPGHWPSGIWRSWLPKSASDSLFWIAWLPYLITLAFGLSGFVALSLPWAIPIGFAFSILWYRNLTEGLDDEREVRMAERSRNIFVGWLCLVLGLSPVYAWHQGDKGNDNYYLPREEAAVLLMSFWHERQLGPMVWVAGDYPENGLVAFYGDSSVKIEEAIPDSPDQNGAIFCPLGKVSLNVVTTPCTVLADAWTSVREERVLKIEYSVSKSGPRFFQDIPFRYRAYLYQH